MSGFFVSVSSAVFMVVMLCSDDSRAKDMPRGEKPGKHWGFRVCRAKREGLARAKRAGPTDIFSAQKRRRDAEL
jgi:hypothetical protein